MNPFRRIFARKSKLARTFEKSIDEMSVYEALALLKNHGDGVPVQTMISVYRRLFDIVWFDHHVEPTEHEIANGMFEAIRTDIINGLSNDPSALESFLDAADAHADNVQFYGTGSLQWIIDEHDITAAQIIPFIVQKQWAEILPTFLTMMDDEVINETRFEILSELVWARRENPDQSDASVIFKQVTQIGRAHV